MKGNRWLLACSLWVVGLSGSFSSAQAALMISAEEQQVFDLAAELYPTLFVKGSELGTYQGYTYKYFAESKVYVGLKDSHVFLMGGQFGPGITDKGSVTGVLTALQAMKAAKHPTTPAAGSAALVISAASTSTLNGTLNKAAAQFEAGSSDAT
ncbi:MAG: hypothetical protein V4603_19235, partial [Pseudomonadota bacterium]